MNSTKAIRIISIEGNIGAGKTTILDKLQERLSGNPDIIFLREPVDIWETIRSRETGENILQSFYGNPKKYAFTFQVMAYSTRLSNLRKAITKNPNSSIIICERSLCADKEIFAQMLYDDGTMDDIQYQVYNRFYNEYTCEYKLDSAIYIDADATTCYNRIQLRNRAGESAIDIEYLQKCNQYHDNWLLHQNPNNEIDVCRIDANIDVSYDINDVNDMGNKWLCEIEQHIYKQK